VAKSKPPVTVAVVTGAHYFDVMNFHRLFRSLDGIDAYIQHMDDWASSSDDVRHGYAATVFYNMHWDAPPAEGLPWYCGSPRAAIEDLGRTERGLVLLHHGILAFQDWPLWGGIAGIEDRKFEYFPGESVHIEIADGKHPVTKGLTAWDMIDETYKMADPGEGSHVLLTTDHPKSMKSIAWTREHHNARVFCLASGHDNEAWAHPSFREVLRRGILWSAGRLA
jgi:hypothetical protein